MTNQGTYSQATTEAITGSKSTAASKNPDIAVSSRHTGNWQMGTHNYNPGIRKANKTSATISTALMLIKEKAV